MKRIVFPPTWSELNPVEHPSLMMKQLFQAACGGLRWLEMKEMAEYIVERAASEGYQRKKVEKTFPKRQKRFPELTKGPMELPSSTKGVELFKGIARVEERRKPKRRLVTYDVLDCTLGGGYHTGAVLENGAPYTRVVALDCDPEAADIGRNLSEEFGANRIRFFCAKMSETLSMFGEKSFDAVIIDPGPSLSQLENPARGFLLNEESEHSLDMRYGPEFGTSGLAFLNTVPQRSLALSLQEYRLLTPEQAEKFARLIRKNRPFNGSIDLFNCIEGVGTDEALESWVNQASIRKRTMPWEFITSLRCIINDERAELTAALQHAMLLLRENGRLVVFSYLPWEEELINRTIQEHPHCVLSYSEGINLEDVNKYGHSRHTKMWVGSRIKGSSFPLKNSGDRVSEEEVAKSQLIWMTGLYGGQTHGFPANNFTFENLEAKEKSILIKNSMSPPFDGDSDKR